MGQDGIKNWAGRAGGAKAERQEWVSSGRGGGLSGGRTGLGWTS